MDASLRAFARALGTPEAGLDLARAALLIAEVEHPGLPVDDYLRALDLLAARSGARRSDDPLHRLHRLREFLFEEEGFRGNVEAYYDPGNSCLNDVLDRRLGIPITLSVVLMEVGRRVGLDIAGVGLPGHFVVSARVGPAAVLLDPFSGGALLTPESCAKLVSRALGRRVALTPALLAPATKRQILVRMLNNLKAIYWQREDWPKTLAITDRLLAADPTLVAVVRDRGTALTRLGEYRRGLADWERYLTERPQAPDAEALAGVGEVGIRQECQPDIGLGRELMAHPAGRLRRGAHSGLGLALQEDDVEPRVSFEEVGGDRRADHAAADHEDVRRGHGRPAGSVS